MDIVTHALLGAASALALRLPGTQAKAAAVAGALGAMLPDIDVFIESSQDPLLVIEYHRQFTHSFLIAPFGAFLVAVACWFAFRQRLPLPGMFWPALIGFLSHIVLDTATSYGVQFLWPFSAQRFSWSVVAVIDPVVTLAVAVGVVLALRAGTPARARVALIVVTLYLGLGWLQQQRVERAILEAAAARGHTPADLTVKPTLGNLILWRSVYRADDEFVIDAVRAGLGATVYRGDKVRRVRPVDLVPPLDMNSVQAADAVRFAVVSQGYLARHPARHDVIGDIRYSMLPDSAVPLWGIEIQAERQEHHARFLTFREFTPQDRRHFFAMLRGAQ
jgi:inner membrane protein